MARAVRLDTEGTECGYLPEDVLMQVMASLPFKSLIRFLTVSKSWNAIVMDPQFHKIRKSFRQEFISQVIQSTKLRNCRLQKSANGMLVLSRGRYEIFVAQPSIVFVKKLPRLDCTLDLSKMEVCVVDVLVDERTKEFSIFALSKVHPILERPGGADQAGRGPSKTKAKQNLHCYDSASDVWSLCGNEGLNLNGWFRVLDGVAVHRDRLMALVKYMEPRADYFRYIHEILYFNGSRWETLPGEFPAQANRGITLFDHRGTLYIASASYFGWALWKYVDDSTEWTSVREFRNPIRPDVELGDGNWESMTYPCAQLFGDFLYFSVFSPQASLQRCRMMMYNLVTERLEDMPYDEGAQVVWVRKPNSAQKKLIQLGGV